MYPKCLRAIAALALASLHSAVAKQRIAPPPGALAVRAGTPPASGMFETINGALAALPNDDSSRTIFIFPGVYNELVNITRPGPLTIYGYTTDTASFAQNEVVIQAGLSLADAGSDDASGTLRVHKDSFSMYNVNVTNTFGPGMQAIAISQYGSKVGLYACAFLGYQDTLYANEGTQVYLKGYIEGAVDFIFGRHGFAYFGGNTIASKGPGCVTASGRETDADGSYVFNQNTIILAPDAVPNTAGYIFLGRPWGVRPLCRVIFKNTVITAPLNQTIWSIWDPGDERIDDVFFAEYNSTGSGLTAPQRPSFSTLLTETQADVFNISSAVGSDYATWVDLDYLV
ncbi:carbohydrate esterase family 8 protein [Hypholoma sublateritium FD-334 SS-4]|uniref:Pectinesterase n=1 Tax=Hypholoma sublateritium (strain FD-334 SS-4) TaxID=945553 RepID=A0A0D2PCH4_HYPSF|nr:carbohydrate esterase family 8 protein [Hypholoma sublateritium FD-334 SS-4]